MLDKIWRFVENIAALTVVAPVFILFFLIVFSWSYDKGVSWIAERGLYESSRLVCSIEREIDFIKRRGGEIAEIRKSTDRNGVEEKESWDERDVLRDSCISLKHEIGEYNRLIQPAYSIVMGDPISMQIHQKFDPTAMIYCDKYSGWR